VLDDIRLAVTDAYFSLPRGGAEIGGILLGHQEKARITIVDAIPMDCEHAFGPSFVLSPRDLSKLGDRIAATDRNPNTKVVGWYHSHTRSELFLSDQDLDIHNKFFPEPWQVALVLKPHTFQPMRAGFFFREKAGRIHAAAPYAEFVLDPMPMRPVPANGSPEPPPLFGGVRDPDRSGPVINVSGVVEPEGAPAPAVEPEPEIVPPSFLTPEAPAASRRWGPWIAIAAGLGLGAWGYQARDEWMRKLGSFAAAPAPDKLALASTDRDGQLHIQWNAASRAALASTSGSLLIVDGSNPPVSVELGRPHVLTGSFTYARRSDRVDVTLILPQPGGREVREATLFASAAPAAPAAVAPPAAEPSGESTQALKAEIARLKQENAAQVERNKRIEKAMDELRKAIQRDEQRKRLELQSPDTAK
jgi:proteasome lid subunit RPN8/RPN11